MKTLILFVAFIAFTVSSSFFACTLSLNAQTTERPRPAEWSNLVYGGRFMDRFLPMPNLAKFYCFSCCLR